MKKKQKAFACICLSTALLAGCSMKDDEVKKDSGKINESTEKAVDDTKKTAEKAKTTTEDSIDNVMTYFKEEGIAYENMQNIENMEFAAHEGRSFMMNGNTAYLYRVKSDDESMKKVMSEAKENGEVKVKVNGKEQEYNAQVNGDYLLLYDMQAEYADLQKAFPNYQQTGVHGTDPKEDTKSTDMDSKKNNSTDMYD